MKIVAQRPLYKFPAIFSGCMNDGTQQSIWIPHGFEFYLRGVRLDDGLPRRAMSIAALVGGMLACPWLCWCVGLLWCRRRSGSGGGRASRLPTTEDVAVRLCDSR